VRKQTSTGDAIPDTYAGYVNVDKDRGSHMFFWMAEARNGNRDAPVIVYLMGGPGAPSSAMMGKGVGPRDASFDPRGQLLQHINPDTWNDKMALIFIDQPIGIGYSYTKDEKNGFAKNDAQVASHISAGIPTIMKRYGKVGNPLYIFGSSYGGKVAPLVGEALMALKDTMGKKGKLAEGELNLRGIGIESGWNKPIDIVQSYGSAFYDRGYIGLQTMKEVNKFGDIAGSILLKDPEAKDSNGEKNGCKAMRYMVEDGVILSKIRRETSILNWYNLRQAFEPGAYFRDVTASIHFANRFAKLLPVGGRSLDIANGGVTNDTNPWQPRAPHTVMHS